MREQIQAYVNGLFADAALTIRNAEVRQEILQHTLDRYDDLVASGKPEQEAYDEAVAGIGDVSELYEHKPAEKQAEAPKSARDFPAPPAAPYAAPAAPAKKKKFPGWAIALICAAVVLLAVLVLNFAGTAAFTVLRTGERYIYDHAGAYETLGRSGCTHRIAVLGDMGELGALSRQAHYDAGALCAAQGVETVLAVGEKSAEIARGAAESGCADVRHFETREAACAVLEKLLGPDCAVLIKASHAMGFQAITARLTQKT